MTALKGQGKAAVKIGMQYGKFIIYYWLKIVQTSKMKTKNQFHGYCQWGSLVRNLSAS